MATTTKATTASKASKASKATTATKYAYVANGNMGQTGLQLRYRGATPQAYKAPLAQVRAWANGNATHTAIVAVLTHTGWFNAGTAANRTSNSPACSTVVQGIAQGKKCAAKACMPGGAPCPGPAHHAQVPAAMHTPGQPVGPQLAAAMQALHAAGAPVQALNAVWACYTGKPKPTA